MSEPANDPLTPRKKWMDEHDGVVQALVAILVAIGFIAIIVISVSIRIQFPPTPVFLTHEGCEVKGINVTTDRSGKVYTDIYSAGCTNSKERIAYFDGPVYDNILEYEKARDAKGDNFIQLHKTYNFTNEVYNVLGQDHERIKGITLVK